jgi:hypothetical protein
MAYDEDLALFGGIGFTFYGRRRRSELERSRCL